MFDEPEESRDEVASDPASRAREKSDEFRMHAELAAVFEAVRKFDAAIRSDLNPEVARDIQRTIAKLDKSKTPESPVLPEQSLADAARLLDLPKTLELPTNDYHISRRPGEVLIVRWLAGDEVESYYERIQAHFDAAMEGYRDEEKQMHAWKSDPATLAYFDALDKVEVKMAEKYLREPIKTHNLFVLSTQAADELDILYLADYVMGVPASEIVGGQSAPPEEQPTEQDRAWFFKLFSLRGMIKGEERMCYFAFLQKAEDTFSDW